MQPYLYSDRVLPAEIIRTLEPLNRNFFHIPDLAAYAAKVTELGKSVALRTDGELASYVLYYDNGPDNFITMVWTDSNHQKQGLAATLIRGIAQQDTKDILLEVHPANPAKALYGRLGFKAETKKDGNDMMRLAKRLVVMQPYFFPYLGYFQLLEAGNETIFYDDVNFIKGGWINRNRILLDGAALLFSVPLAGASPNREIKDIQTVVAPVFRKKFQRQLVSAYSRAPFFGPVSQMVLSILDAPGESIADLAISSIIAVYDYLGLSFKWSRSSVRFMENKGIGRQERLLDMVKKTGYRRYVNASGGTSLYDKADFEKEGVALDFVHPVLPAYPQDAETFVPGLSIIDVLMHNEPKKVRDMFAQTQWS